MNSDNGSYAGLATSAIYTDFSGLAQLRAQVNRQSPEASREVAQQFEALFLQMMLKSMRAAGGSELAGDSEQTRFYQEMFDKQIALDLARGQGIGLVSMLERQLAGVAVTQRSDQTPTAPVAASRQAAVTEAHDWRPADAETFIRDLWPHASRVSRTLGVEPGVLIAQAALETGWGQNTIRHTNGRSSLNLFGIKADSKWDGDRVVVATLEYENGIARKQNASFRAYSSLSASMDDYMNFLQSNPRYRQALDSAADAGGFLRELQDAGYATDPAYANKITSILGRDEFRRSLDRLQAGDRLYDRESA